MRPHLSWLRAAQLSLTALIPIIPLSMPLDLCSTLKPMKLVEHADGIMEEAERRFRDHQSNMRSGDRDVAEDRLIR